MSGELVPADDLPDSLVPADDLPQGSLSIRGRAYIEPNALQRRAGIRRNRFKDENLAGNVASGFLTLGEDVGRETTGVLAAAGASPDVANLGGFVADAGSTLLPVGPAGRTAAAAAAPIADPAARRVMQAALKPNSRALMGGDASKAAQAVETMLQEGVSPTAAGAAKLRTLINTLKAEVAQIIAQSPATVNLGHAYRSLAKSLDEVGEKGIGYGADREAVLKAWDEFKNHPLFSASREVSDEVPIQIADRVKRATQQSVDYTTPVRSATDSARVAAAHGLREGMEAADPRIIPFNKKMSEYINALHLIEPRAAQTANKDLGGLALLGQTPEATMMMLADRNPWMKAYIARVLQGGQLPSATARTGVVGAETLTRE